MSLIKLHYRNILETGTVAVTTENSSFPKYRLHDRDTGKLFKGTSTPANFYITVNQGASLIYEIDRCIIPVGHNLNGLALKVQYSTDNFAANTEDAVSWTQGDALVISKSFTAQTKQYWRLNIAAPGSNPEMTELFLSKDYTFEENPRHQGSSYGLDDNIERWETSAGRARRVKLGDLRKHFSYDLSNIAAAQKANLIAWEQHTEGAKFTWLTDQDGTVIYCEKMNKLQFGFVSDSIFSTSIELLEVLGV